MGGPLVGLFLVVVYVGMWWYLLADAGPYDEDSIDAHERAMRALGRDR